MDEIQILARELNLSFNYKVSRYGGQVHLHVYSDREGKAVIIEQDEITHTIKVCKEA